MNKTAILQRGQRLIDLYRDREFFSRLFTVALPIILQNFITSSLNLVGGVMIGQLGETAVAAVGLSNQIFFLLTLLLFGINSGAAIFTAQLWGRGDVANIRRVLGLSLGLSLLGSALFTTLSLLVPKAVLGIYTEDAAVVSLGGGYLRLFGLSFLFTAVTFCFSTVLRSTGDVKTPLWVSIAALSVNTLLSYGLIFGILGLAPLGVQGAAIAIVISRILECAALLAIVYRRRGPAAAPLRELADADLPFMRKILARVLPVAFNEVLWSVGVTTYFVIYARIGTDSIAAMNIAVTIDNLALVLFIGISHATAILVGNIIGSGDERKAYHYAGRALSLGVAGAALTGLVIYGSADLFLSLYKVSPQVIQYAREILTIIALFLWLRVSNMLLFVGIFRSGGDTRFGFILDGGAIWLIGVPLAYLGAFILHLPIYLVYLLVMSEELFKFLISMWRFLSRRWIHNLTHGI